MAKDDKKEAAPRNFGVFLAQMEEGGLVEDLSAELVRANVELSKHAEHNGKARGQITVVIDLAYQANGTVDATGEIKVKLPKSKRSRTVFWDRGDGNLSNKNPKQESFPFREVNADRVVKEVSNG